MPLDVKQQRVFHAIWDEARRIYSPIGTLVVNGTASATIVVIIKIHSNKRIINNINI